MDVSRGGQQFPTDRTHALFQREPGYDLLQHFVVTIRHPQIRVDKHTNRLIFAPQGIKSTGYSGFCGHPRAEKQIAGQVAALNDAEGVATPEAEDRPGLPRRKF